MENDPDFKFIRLNFILMNAVEVWCKKYGYENILDDLYVFDEKNCPGKVAFAPLAIKGRRVLCRAQNSFPSELVEDFDIMEVFQNIELCPLSTYQFLDNFMLPHYLVEMGKFVPCRRSNRIQGYYQIQNPGVFEICGIYVHRLIIFSDKSQKFVITNDETSCVSTSEELDELIKQKAVDFNLRYASFCANCLRK